MQTQSYNGGICHAHKAAYKSKCSRRRWSILLVRKICSTFDGLEKLGSYTTEHVGFTQQIVNVSEHSMRWMQTKLFWSSSALEPNLSGISKPLSWLWWWLKDKSLQIDAEGCYHVRCLCEYEFCCTCGIEWKNKERTLSIQAFECYLHMLGVLDNRWDGIGEPIDNTIEGLETFTCKKALLGLLLS